MIKTLFHLKDLMEQIFSPEGGAKGGA